MLLVRTQATVSSLVCYIALAGAWSTFIVPHTDGTDDTPALMAAISGYTSDASIVFQTNTTYNIWSPIVFPELTNVEVVVEGNLSYPKSIQTVQDYIAASNQSDAWITFMGGRNVTLRGTTDPNWGWVDGHGQQWWDVMQQVNRPAGWRFKNIDTGVIRDMKIYKPIAWNFLTTGSNNLYFFNNTILARSDSDSFPFNTDGFGAGGSNMLFEYNHVVNGDDCLAVGDGSKNITWRNGYCEGSHGLSVVGSFGDGAQASPLENVLFENTIMNRSLYAARFKSSRGSIGLVTNVTWRNILFIDVMFPILITQNYWDQVPLRNTSGIRVTHVANFVFENFAGTINDDPGYKEGSCITNPCWYHVPGATGKEVVIFDLYPNTATNVVTENVFAQTLTGSPVAVMCNTSTITTDIGFVCRDGPYVPTLVGL